MRCFPGEDFQSCAWHSQADRFWWVRKTARKGRWWTLTVQVGTKKRRPFHNLTHAERWNLSFSLILCSVTKPSQRYKKFPDFKMIWFGRWAMPSNWCLRNDRNSRIWSELIENAGTGSRWANNIPNMFVFRSWTDVSKFLEV